MEVMVTQTVCAHETGRDIFRRDRRILWTPEPLTDFWRIGHGYGKKAGGSYVTATGNLKKTDEYERVIVFANGKQIPYDDVFDITSGSFKDL